MARARSGWALVRRIAIALVGGLVVAVGVALLGLPGPGFLVIFFGLGILATEFAFAMRAKHQVERQARKAARKATARRRRRLAHRRVG